MVKLRALLKQGLKTEADILGQNLNSAQNLTMASYYPVGLSSI